MISTLSRYIRCAGFATLLLAPAVSSTPAESAGCVAPLEPMLRSELSFGRHIGKHFGVTERLWQDFVTRELTPRFPAGFTVFDGLGQYADGKILVRERSKIVVVVAPDAPATHERLAAVMAAYIKQFKQKAVGQVIQSVCAAF